MSTTTISGKSVLVTGANRGLGQALVDEALRRGASRVYAASRQPLTHADRSSHAGDHGRDRVDADPAGC